MAARERVACKWRITSRYAHTWPEPKFPTPKETFWQQGMTWSGTMLYSLSQFADFRCTNLLSGLITWNWSMRDGSPKLRMGLSVTNHPISLPPCRDVLLLMAALACGYDPHWPLWHKMCEGNQSLVSHIRAAVIGSQRSLVPLNYPLTQPCLLGPSGGALPAAPPYNWWVPPGAFKPHKASCSWGVRLH